MPKLVRLYPYNPKKGRLKRIYLDPTIGKFDGDRGWYEVSDEHARRLGKVLQKTYVPDSGPAFMIANDKDHAAQLEAQLREPTAEEIRKGTVEEPIRQHRVGQRSSVAVESEAEEAPKARTRKRRSAE